MPCLPRQFGVFMRSSPEARRLVKRSGVAKGLFFVRSLLFHFLTCFAWFYLSPAHAFAQDSSHQTPPTNPAPPAETKQNSAELATHDEPATFKVNVKLVVVRAVVRDSQGRAIGNLRQEDFQVFDKGKPQVIPQFEVEQPGTMAAKVRRESVENSGDTLAADTSPNTVNAPPMPERFVA